VSPRLDVIVLGGGPAGAAAATVLARAGARTLLVHRPPRRPARHAETIALFPGLSPDGPVAALPSYGVQSSWGGDVLLDHDFIGTVGGLRWHVDRPALDERLRAAAQTAGARLQQVTAVRWARQPGGWRVELGDGAALRTVEAGWLVDCTGRSAHLARSQSAPQVRGDRLVAFSVRLGPIRPGGLEQRTRLEAVRDGWWYLAPIPPDGAALTFLTDGDLGVARAARRAAGLAALLAETRYIQGWVDSLDCPLAGPVQAAPAGMTWLASAAGDGWLAAGDAALAGDPIGGQGVLQARALGERAAAALLHDGPVRQAALAGYQAYLARLSDTYRRLLRQVYAAEWRWPEAPFWARRRAGWRSTP
jgi:flavin-dependent dehydrogenase